MSKKIIITIIVVVLIISAIPVVIYYLNMNSPVTNITSGVDDLSPPVNSESNVNNSNGAIQPDTMEMKEYENTRYGYTIKYPSNWYVSYIGEGPEEEALGLMIASNKSDLTAGDGGLPQGVKIDLYIHDLEEFKEVDDSFPEINSIEGWLEWQKANQASAEGEMQGEANETEIIFNGIDAILQVYEKPEVEEYGKSRVHSFLNPEKNKVFVIQYTGSEPLYSDQVPTYDKIAKSFKFINN